MNDQGVVLGERALGQIANNGSVCQREEAAPQAKGLLTALLTQSWKKGSPSVEDACRGVAAKPAAVALQS